VSLEEKHDILKGEGLCPDTKDKRNKIFEHFTSFIKNSLKVAGPFTIKQALEDNIVTRAKVYQFYNDCILSYRVEKTVRADSGAMEKRDELPRFKTIETVKSHIKMACIKEIKLNLTDQVEFPDEAGFWKDYLTHLKENRKMKIDHYKTLPPDVLDAAYELFANATAAYHARGQENYREYLKKIPAEWKDKYHYLLQWGAMWFATLLEVNRGREGIHDLLQTDFQTIDKGGGGCHEN